MLNESNKFNRVFLVTTISGVVGLIISIGVATLSDNYGYFLPIIVSSIVIGILLGIGIQSRISDEMLLSFERVKYKFVGTVSLLFALLAVYLFIKLGNSVSLISALIFGGLGTIFLLINTQKLYSSELYVFDKNLILMSTASFICALLGVYYYYRNRDITSLICAIFFGVCSVGILFNGIRK